VGALKPRLAGLRGDIHSLIEYEEQLSSKVQFVLDALVGLIGIAQNDVFKVLTIVSIVGIPPTLVAGIYLWHKLQEHAGIRLGLGLSIRLDGYHSQRAHSPDLVQAERLVLATDHRAPKPS
jgi:CorA-like Mg2+ transporter protein